MMNAYTAIVLNRYIMLAVENQNSKDNRTLSELFYVCYVCYVCFDKLQYTKFNDFLALILELFTVTLQDFFMRNKKQLFKQKPAYIISLITLY